MAQSEAKIGYGTLLKFETAAGSGVFTAVAEVRNITGLPALETDEVEVTHMESPDSIREFIAGLKTPGQLDFEINYILTHATHDSTTGLRALQISGEVRDWQVVFVDFNVTFQGPGFVKSFQPQAPVDGAITATVAVKQAGAWDEL